MGRLAQALCLGREGMPLIGEGNGNVSLIQDCVVPHHVDVYVLSFCSGSCLASGCSCRCLAFLMSCHVPIQRNNSD